MALGFPAMRGHEDRYQIKYMRASHDYPLKYGFPHKSPKSPAVPPPIALHGSPGSGELLGFSVLLEGDCPSFGCAPATLTPARPPRRPDILKPTLLIYELPGTGVDVAWWPAQIWAAWCGYEAVRPSR